MNITGLALKNAQFVIIITLIAILLGVRSFLDMPRSEDPQVDFPFYMNIVAYPGTSPEDMETLIVDPIEEAIKKVDDITRIESNIREGLAIIQMEASFDVDSQDKYDDLLREITAVRPSLPQNLPLFTFEQIKPEDRVNFILLALTSESTPYEYLYDIADDIKEEIDNVDGVKGAQVEAYPQEEIRITVDYERMAAMNVNLRQIATTLQSNNVNIPGGDVSAGTKNFTIKGTGGYKNIQEIKNTIITGLGDRIVYLKDVAQITKTYGDQLWMAEYNQEKAIYVSAKLKRGYNIIAVNKQIQKIVRSNQNQLPPEVKLNVAFEQATAVSDRINEFFKNLLQGIALVGIVILLALGWRAAFIIMALIPLCIILSLALLNNSGYALQQISVASLVLALGLLVDNGIVVIENITRFLKEGMERKEASLKGPSEVGLAILASTVTTLLSFFPLTQLGDAPGLFLISLPLTVIYTLVISLILALTFSPILSTWIMPKYITKATFADRFFQWISNRIYRPILGFSLRFGWLIIIIAIAITAFSISLFPKIGVSFFPTADKPLLLIDIDLPKASSLEATADAVDYVEDLIDSMDIVTDYYSNVGNSSPQIYYNKIPKQLQKNHGQVVAHLKEWKAETFYRTIADLRFAFSKYPGAKITVEELKNGAPVPAPIEILIVGDDLDILKSLTQRVESIYRKFPDVINIFNPLARSQPIVKVTLDKAKAGLLGVDELAFDQTIRASMNGLQIDQVSLGDQEEYALVLRMPFDQQPSLADFNKIYIANTLGGQIPLSHIAKIEFDGAPAEFSHFDLNRNAPVLASVINLDNTIPRTVEIIEELDKIDWPRGYKYIVRGEYDEQQSTFGSLGIILLLAQIAIFAVLVLQFRSILQPLIVFAAIPLAVSGSFFALYLSGWPFSFFAFVGIISLIGIVVNNSIILVDYINQLRNEGVDSIEAIYTGSIRRLKPILLTTITTILGLLPLTLQGTNQWSPLCWAIIGGMISSSLLTLIVVPVLYKSPGDWWKNIKNVFTF